MPNGRRFTVVAEDFGVGIDHIGAVTLNGEPMARAQRRHEQTMAGGEPRFTMQAAPGTWGAAPAGA